MRMRLAAAALLAVVPTGVLAADGTPQKALIDRYCVGCHNPRNKANVAGLDLTTVDPSPQAKNTEVFEKVLAKLRAGMMPPAGQRRPDALEATSFISYLEHELDRAAAASPNPGRTEPFHRLNRAEYHNAVR